MSSLLAIPASASSLSSSLLSHLMNPTNVDVQRSSSFCIRLPQIFANEASSSDLEISSPYHCDESDSDMDNADTFRPALSLMELSSAAALASSLPDCPWGTPESLDGTRCPLPEGECLMCMRDVPPCLSSRSPSWSAIMHVVLFSLHHCHPERTYFNLQSDIYPLVDYHWANLFSQKTNVHNWHKQLQDSMSHKRKLFQSGKGNMRKNGYWRLRTLKDPWTAGDHVTITQPRTVSPTPTSPPSSSSSSSPSSSPEVFTFAGSTDSPSSSRRTNFTSRVPVRRLSFDHNDLAQTKKRRLSIPTEAADTDTHPSASASALTVLQQGILHTTATLSDTLRTLQRDMQTATEANEEMLAGGLALLSSARRDAVAHASDVISYSQELTRKHQDDFCKLWQNIEQTHVVS
eukprot:TRINITY_DN3278_c0_g1_i4.p1 TRINITY_DN3278_c0_g1~~TRINITY_DN3278_c0_g1_i4.p1  ORF type:complete len:404 (-),score=113.09 TRINITY_DN3278_c0_g1_i4:82-1293(-)